MEQVNALMYKDYRKFLRDFVEVRRQESAKYSLIWFSLQIGASESYLKLVAAGKRSLNVDLAGQLARRMKLSAVETSYFLTLVMREAARTDDMRVYFDSVLAGYRKLAMPYSQGKDRTEIFYDITMWEIFSLIGVEGFCSEPEWILAHLTRKGLTVARVKAAWDKLVGSGAVVFEDGRYHARDIVLQHEKFVEFAYQVALRRAVHYLEENPGGTDSHFDAFCLIMSDAEFAEVRRVLEEARGRIVEVVKRKGPKNMIGFLNLNLFPVSR